MLYIGGNNDYPFFNGNRFTAPTIPFVHAPNVVPLSLPNLIPPTYPVSVLPAFQNLTVADNQTQPQTQAPDNSKCNPFTGQDCHVSPLGQSIDNAIQDGINSATSGLLGQIETGIAGFAKKFFLLVLAIVLVAFGLYFMAKSTDTGKIVIGATKKALA